MTPPIQTTTGMETIRIKTKTQATINLMLLAVIRYLTKVICAYANKRVYRGGSRTNSAYSCIRTRWVCLGRTYLNVSQIGRQTQWRCVGTYCKRNDPSTQWEDLRRYLGSNIHPHSQALYIQIARREHNEIEYRLRRQLTMGIGQTSLHKTHFLQHRKMLLAETWRHRCVVGLESIERIEVER